jgi:hypothetical protein
MASVLLAIALTGSTLLPAELRKAGTNVTSSECYSSPRSRQDQVKEILMSDVLADDDLLSYGGYVVEKRHKKVRDDFSAEIQSRPSLIEVSYVVLKRQRNTLLTLDGGIYFGMGNSTRFGLFSFLPGPTKQLVVSQDIFRGGTQWVIDLTSRPRLVFDGPKWEVGREGDDMKIMDLDGDGVFEISVPTCIFYGFGNLSPGATPLPVIIFKYSKQVRRYLPANPQFANHLLADIQNQTQNLPSVSSEMDKMNHVSGVLGIVLDYVFMGREQEAWTFYDQAYKLPDKDRFKTLVRARLSHSPVYRFIYHKNARKR